jgi:hypothetical protein
MTVIYYLQDCLLALQPVLVQAWVAVQPLMQPAWELWMWRGVMLQAMGPTSHQVAALHLTAKVASQVAAHTTAKAGRGAMARTRKALKTRRQKRHLASSYRLSKACQKSLAKALLQEERT